jgi:hypothetical protein
VKGDKEEEYINGKNLPKTQAIDFQNQGSLLKIIFLLAIKKPL